MNISKNHFLSKSLRPVLQSEYAFVVIKNLGLGLFIVIFLYGAFAHSSSSRTESVQACVFAPELDLTDPVRAQLAQCLGWHSDKTRPMCKGYYQPAFIQLLSDPEQIRILADRVSFYQNKGSTLNGHVEVQQAQRVVHAETAYVYRDPKTNKVIRIELLGNVHYLEPGRLMIGRKALLNPQNKSGQVDDVLYRFDTQSRSSLLAAWGRASLVKRFPNEDYLLRKGTYTTCAPQDKSWEIQADSIVLDKAKATGVARGVRLKIQDWPVLYTPYLSFPTNNDRKSGFLMPQVGYSNVGGLDVGLPYYLNIAPNQDLTLVPHSYSERGVMMGGEYRYLTSNSMGFLSGNFLPQDRAYGLFLQNHETVFPWLQGNSNNRWSAGFFDTTVFNPDLRLDVNLQQVSDDYYLQDFSSNLAFMTERQLVRQADLVYSSEHWVLRGMGQSYQTLEPINEIPIRRVYQRLPQLSAQGTYYNLPFNGQFSLLSQYDQFHWPRDRWETPSLYQPEGPRFHANPMISFPQIRPWGYLTPSIELVENYYQVQHDSFHQAMDYSRTRGYNRTIPRYSVDGGLNFERQFSLYGGVLTQTLEPRLFYLNVPFQNQTPIPVYDSGYMIFNVDQLTRTNRFSGFDRIGDSNQLTYSLSTRWLLDSGAELARFSIGQIHYFAHRKVLLCQDPLGFCLEDPYAFGFLSPEAKNSPIASQGIYHFNSIFGVTGDYVWNPYTGATNNGDLNVHYQPGPNKIINFGYSYLFNGDLTQIRKEGSIDNALHQAVLAFAWPLTDRWSTLGAYSQNISKNYSMMSLLGMQYDNCCWAVRLIAGRSFQSLNAQFEPQYNNNIYLQILLKGLGSVANSDPNTVLSTYLPGYHDPFRR